MGGILGFFSILQILPALNELRPVLEGGWVGEGPKVREFEIALGKRFKTPFVNAVNSGTMGLEIIASMIGLKEGDEVITTPMTCMATNEPFARTGATLVWADVDPQTGNIDPASVAQKVTEKTKAVVLVHWGGYPADITGIRAAVSKSSNYIYVIEDAAHANGALYKGNPIGMCNYGLGNHSDYAMFSFQAIKQMTSIDGGAVTCYRAEDYERFRVMRWYGIDRRYRKESLLGHPDWEIRELGYKGHMNDVNATIGLVHLRYLDEVLKKRRRNARIFDEGLKGVSGVKRLPIPLEQQIKEKTISSYYLYTIQVDDRKNFVRALKDRGISTSVVHIRNDRYFVFRKFGYAFFENLVELVHV